MVAENISSPLLAGQTAKQGKELPTGNFPSPELKENSALFEKIDNVLQTAYQQYVADFSAKANQAQKSLEVDKWQHKFFNYRHLQKILAPVLKEFGIDAFSCEINYTIMPRLERVDSSFSPPQATENLLRDIQISIAKNIGTTEDKEIIYLNSFPDV